MAIKISYRPRRYFMPFHIRRCRWAILVAHRRAGKTVAAVNDLIDRASRNPLPNPRYAYIAPLLKQARDIAWMYLKEAAAPFNPKISESGLYVELSALPNSPRITLYGADNPDSFRGIYLDGAVLDEFGNMVESTWTEVLLPALIDRRGWAVFMGTPNGPNHFRDMFYERRNDADWYVAHLPHTQTGVIPEDMILEMKKIMEPEQFAQEMLCSFEASIRGAIYAREVETMEQQLRIGEFTSDRFTPVDVVMDLGFRDLSTMGFVQQRPDGLLMEHCHGDNMKPIKHYIKYIKEYWGDNKMRPGQIWLPHDARARSLQTGKSIIEHFRDAKLRPKIVPQLDLLDGIAASRKIFGYWYLNKPKCEKLVLALKTYHRKYDETLKVYSNEPVHDWSSHYADMWRYANIVCDLPDIEEFMRTRAPKDVQQHARPVHYGFNLNDLWKTAPRTQPRRL